MTSRKSIRVFPAGKGRGQTRFFTTEEGREIAFTPCALGTPVPAGWGTGCIEREGGRLYLRENLAPSEAQKLAEGGPTQVATVEYRDGWDRIFSKPQGAN